MRRNRRRTRGKGGRSEERGKGRDNLNIEGKQKEGKRKKGRIKREKRGEETAQIR